MNIVNEYGCPWQHTAQTLWLPWHPLWAKIIARDQHNQSIFIAEFLMKWIASPLGLFLWSAKCSWSANFWQNTCAMSLYKKTIDIGSLFLCLYSYLPTIYLLLLTSQQSICCCNFSFCWTASSSSLLTFFNSVSCSFSCSSSSWHLR